MTNKKCVECNEPATVQVNMGKLLCSEHALKEISQVRGQEARKLRLYRVK